MRKFLALLVMGLVMLPGLSLADSTFNLGSSTTGFTDGSYYVGTVYADLGSTPIKGGVTCLDALHESNFNSSWPVNVETIATVTSTRFCATVGLQGYEEAAWLNTQLLHQTTPTPIAQIQHAIWDVFDPGFNTDTGNWLTQAQGITNWAGYNFSTFRIYTPTCNGSNQEFMSGGACAPAPVPPSVLLLGSGLLGLGCLRLRRV